jgi:ankyrin repeat protein
MEWLLYMMVNINQVSFTFRWISCVFLTASRWGHKDIFEISLSKVAVVNVLNIDGSTSLHLSELLFNCINISLISFLFLASKTGEKDIVEFLLSKGADVNAKDKNGMTALHYGE